MGGNTQPQAELPSVLNVIKSCVNLHIDTALMKSLNYRDLLFLVLDMQVEKITQMRALEENSKKDYYEEDATASDILKGA